MTAFHLNIILYSSQTVRLFSVLHNNRETGEIGAQGLILQIKETETQKDKGHIELELELKTLKTVLFPSLSHSLKLQKREH